MGFWGNLWEDVKSVATDTYKTVSDFFSGKSKKISKEAESFTAAVAKEKYSSSNVKSVQETNDQINLFQKEVKACIDEFEDETINRFVSIFSPVIDLYKNNDLLDVKSLLNELNRLENDIRGTLGKRIERKISLDNDQYKEILMMDNMSQRKKSIALYHNSEIETAKALISQKVKSNVDLMTNYMYVFFNEVERKKSINSENIIKELIVIKKSLQGDEKSKKKEIVRLATDVAIDEFIISNSKNEIN